MKIKFSCRATKAELVAALNADAADKTALMSFLAGARSADATFGGRTASEAILAATRLLRISDVDPVGDKAASG